MTLVSDIISDAYRESNLIPLGASPSAAQSTEALNRLNPLVLQCVGNEGGDELQDLNYGGDYDQSDYINQWIPDNTRLVLNLTAALNIYADPEPYEGQRLAFVDVAGNLATYNMVIDGNGRTIEDTATVTLNTDGENRQWMYRGDTGNWVKIGVLTDADEMPFPVEFNDYFVTMLALRLNPRYGQGMASESIEALKRSRAQLRARYRRKSFDVKSDPGLLNPRESLYGSTDGFNTGRYWPWN